jgi:hypothetical protein
MNAADKPLQKDLSFWIVAVVLVGAATAAQLYFGVPWFAQRLAQVRPAPRSLTSAAATTRPPPVPPQDGEINKRVKTP